MDNLKHMPDSELTRLELVKKLISLLDEANSMSLRELCIAGAYAHDPSLRYPQTKSEYIVEEALSLLLIQDWVDDDPLLDEMTSILGLLDTGVDRMNDWLELKRLTEELKTTIVINEM